MTWPRSRMGRACTARNPACAAAAANSGPALAAAGEVIRGDGLAGAEAVQAWSLVVLQLEQLDQLGCLAGGRRDAQLAARVGEHHAGRGRGEQADAAVGEHVQEVDDVEVGHHGVGQVDESVGQQIGVHLVTLSSGQEVSAAGGSAAEGGRHGSLSCSGSRIQLQAPGDDVAGHVSEPPVLR